MNKAASFTFDHQAKSSRFLALITIFPFKFFWMFPVIALGIGTALAIPFIAGLGIIAVFFTGKYPKYFHDIIEKTVRTKWRINSYLFCMTDKYPEFSLENYSYPANISIQYQEKVSRFSALITPIKPLLLIPHVFVLVWYEIIAFIALVWGILSTLFTGNYPKSSVRRIVRFADYAINLAMYLLCVTDKYPSMTYKQ